jgi:N-acetylglucosaminyldiphosphoundecaprenol N-acetyl-beta-D-mannosaminyltransferase
MIRRDRILGARVDAGGREELLERILSLANGARTTRVLFANVHMVVESRRDAALREAMETADLVCPDGMPLVRLLGDCERLEGMSAFPELIGLAQKGGLSVALFGSTPEILSATVDKIRLDHPGLEIVLSLAPPFGADLEGDVATHSDLLRASGARLVFVALGCPRQEIWMAGVRDVPACFLGVGNAFEIHVGRRRRAPRWARSLCLEWLFRLIQEPRRLGPRYLSTNLRFLLGLPGEIVRRRRR